MEIPVTTVIVNYRTLGFTRRCLRSLLRFYPCIRVIMVDNDSQDRSARYIELAAIFLPRVQRIITERNLGHGDALHRGVLMCCQTQYVLTLDSDVEVLKGGWIELMLDYFTADSKLFAVGNVGYADHSGTRPGDRPFVHPFCALWDIKKYHELGRFVTSGQPTRNICFAATEAGYNMKNISGIHPRCERHEATYVYHRWGGTRLREVLGEIRT